MDRFVKGFIAASILYLAVASIMGVAMSFDQNLLGALKFPHSHLMLLGWVSMMIYGVGYHILPRFAGRMLKSPALGELHFWVANAALIGMVVFYPLMQYHPEVGGYRWLAVLSGALQAVSIFLFFYNMIVTVFARAEEH